MRLGAKELRVSRPSKRDISTIKRREIYIICDNVLDTYNIGSIFRLADAVGAKCVYLCGGSETPPNPKIAKASVGTDKWVSWRYFETAVEAISSIRHSRLDRESDPRFREDDKKGSEDDKKGSEDDKKVLKVIAIEQSKDSIDFRQVNYEEPVAFVVGHETEGVSEEVLALADQIVEIPMFGVNISLNVMVSLAIVLYSSIKYYPAHTT